MENSLRILMVAALFVIAANTTPESLGNFHRVLFYAIGLTSLGAGGASFLIKTWEWVNKEE